MTDLQVGDQVKVYDSGLAMMRAILKEFGEDPGPNNLGWVAEVWDDEILVEFPIGDDDPEEHSQVAPYPKSQVHRFKWEENDDGIN